MSNVSATRADRIRKSLEVADARILPRFVGTVIDRPDDAGGRVEVKTIEDFKRVANEFRSDPHSGIKEDSTSSLLGQLGLGAFAILIGDWDASTVGPYYAAALEALERPDLESATPDEEDRETALANG